MVESANPSTPEPAHTNALAHETSPYLLQHAHNPVDWMPWGPAAFQKARDQDKPIFLSIGYATCYWCHVMERQVFENEDLAAALNQRCVCIKVDREQRPDVDDIYMTATQMITRRGGWPMSVFLTPPPPPPEVQARDAQAPAAQADARQGLLPFWAGTYIPPEPMQGMPGFRQVVDGIADAWQNKRDQVLDQAEQVAKAVREYMNTATAPGNTAGFSSGGGRLIQDAAQQLLHTYDPEHGGFTSGGSAPKFPQPTNLLFLLAVHRNNKVGQIGQAVAHTLDRMARGGIYDQIAGGFHRYSTDGQWLIPHFEKMLYDNGQLLEAYAQAYVETDASEEREQYERILRETAGYVLRDMTDATGALWSAQDAEVNASEGQNYVWTEPEARDAIDDEQLADLAMKMYGINLGSNFRDPHDLHGKPVNVLYLPMPLHQLADEVEGVWEKRQTINDRLKTTRDTRDQPATDGKVLTSWNGLMIAGLAKAGRVLGEAEFIDAAARAADAVLKHMADPAGDDGLLRTMRDGVASIPAFLEDYTMLAHGLIELHRARPDAGYLDHAQRLTAAAIQRFAAEYGGYFDTLPDQADLFVRVRGATDGAMPSGNSVMAHNLLDLYELTGNREYLERVAGDLRSFAPTLERMPMGAVHLVHAALRLMEIAPGSLDDKGMDSPANAPGDPVHVELEPADLGVIREPTRAELVLTIDRGYHLSVPGQRGVEPLSVASALPEAYGVEVALPEPAVRELADGELSVYEGTIRVGLTIKPRGTPDRPLRLRLRYQACSDSACLAPKSLTLPAT